MKVNSPAGGSSQYQAYVQSLKNAENGTKTQGEARVPVSDAANTDKVTFSENAAARAEISRLSTTVSAEVDEVSAERMAQLSAAVEEGTYFVESGALADSILGKFGED